MKLDDNNTREVIKFFNKFVKKEQFEKSKHKCKIGEHTIRVRDIHKHLSISDEIGNTILFATKLFMQFMESTDWKKEICKNSGKKEESKKFSKQDNDTIIVFLPDGLWKGEDLESKFHEKLKTYEDTYNIKYLSGNRATKKNLEDIWKVSGFIYLTAVTHGLPNALFDQNGVMFKCGNDFTKNISINRHFHFVGCFSGLVLARCMVDFYDAEFVHAYPFPYLYTDVYEPYIDATSQVDINLLDGLTHGEAHKSCTEMYRIKSACEWAKVIDKDEKDKEIHFLNSIFLWLDGCFKHIYGDPNSKLPEKPPGISTVHINKIEMEKEIQRVWWFRKIRAKAIVSVLDERGKPVSGAVVSGLWSSNAINKSKDVTKSTGKVELISDWFWSRRGRFTFTVENIEQKGREYAPNENKQTSGSIDINIWGLW